MTKSDECREDKFAALEANVKELRECLQIAFEAFSHDDDGPVWADSLIARTEKVLKVTADRIDTAKKKHRLAKL